jgi:hypothetical protein
MRTCPSILSQNATTAQRFLSIGSIYEHYKGRRYKIIGVARHSETLEELVVYQSLCENGDLWVRPLGMFLENITLNGHSQPRFKLVG